MRQTKQLLTCSLGRHWRCAHVTSYTEVGCHLTLTGRSVNKKRRSLESRPMIVDLWSANTKLAPNRLLGGVDSPCGSTASRPLKPGGSCDGFGGAFVADAAPRLANDIIITIDDERLVILRGRRLATRESPRTAAGPIHSCAGHRCVGP